MQNVESKEFSYDTLPYPSFTFAQTHPDRFAAIGKFYGIETASPKKCRVLELGCGDGTNLNWLAYSLPESEFIGVDLSQIHIDSANQAVTEIGLKNAKFFQQDVMQIDENTFGKFDYIFAHGLFSWVPDFVREKILELYRQLLNPNGIGYLSYNTFPGCYRRKIVRDAMRFHTKKYENPLEKVQQGIAFLNFLTENSTSSPIHHEILKHEFDGMLKRSESNVFHDDLADENQPFYFTEFIEFAEKNDLQFLSEINNFPTQPRKISPEVLQVLENISDNVIEFEQYFDFLESNRFRQTLLCQKEIEPERNFEPNKIKQFAISSNLNPTAEITRLSENKSEKFISPKGSTAETDHILTKAVLFYLHTIGTHEISFDELIAKSRETLETEGFTSDDWERESDITASLLFQLYSPDSIRFHVSKSNCINFVSEKPKVSEFAKWQAEKGQNVTTFHGLNLSLDDEIIVELFRLLDGTKSKNDVISELFEKVQNVEIEAFTQQIEQYLSQIARVGLLIK
ncbi:MAG: class I SAM-dependent methyltransferase [Pyrinomonadaceae bacterium]|nr:class I SAM-dependent methyltransferase [Pyrinomonadaceae bacterium]